MRVNPDKFHLLVDDSDTNLSIKVDNYEIKNSNEEKLLGITFDNKLAFETHVSNLSKKANQKLHALSRVSHYMDERKIHTIIKAFINSQIWLLPISLDVSQ